MDDGVDWDRFERLVIYVLSFDTGANASVYSDRDHFTGFDRLQSAPRLDVVPLGILSRFRDFLLSTGRTWMHGLTA